MLSYRSVPGIVSLLSNAFDHYASMCKSALYQVEYSIIIIIIIKVNLTP